jgi:hypothetical protein
VGTVYLEVIDEEALGRYLFLERVGEWEGELPKQEIPDHLKPTLMDGCGDVPPKASLAAYAVLEGMLEGEDFEDGTFLGGTCMVPIAAFHDPMYATMTEKMAETLAGYERIVARNFANGQPRQGKPRCYVAARHCEVYEEQWPAPGGMSDEVIVWEVLGPALVAVLPEADAVAEAATIDSAGLEEASGTPAAEDAEDAPDGATEPAGGVVVQRPSKPAHRTRLVPVAVPA